MLDDDLQMPDDPDDLKDLVTRLTAEVKTRDLLIAKLEHQLAGHRRHRFGTKSETLDQLQLRLEDEEVAAARDEKPTPSERDVSEEGSKPKRRPLPPELLRNEEVLTPGETCACGGKLRKLGEDVTEELEYIPGRFVVNRIVRPRLACSRCEAIVQAPLPSRPIERGRPGPVYPNPAARAEDTLWASREAFGAWTKSEAFREAHCSAGGNRHMYLEGPHFEGFDVVQHMK